MYSHMKMETLLGMGGEGIRRMMEGVQSTRIYYKNFYKCYNVPPIQQ
jgi:hypothetical protein